MPLHNLKMGTRPVVDYITEFETHAPHTGYNDEALIQWFKVGLNSALLNDCMSTFPMPKTLPEWKERARDRNAAFIERSRFQKSRPSTGKPPVSNRSPQSTSASRPRTVAAAETRLPRLTEQDRERLRREGACFRCRQKGHMSRDCVANSTPSVRALETGPAPGVAQQDQSGTLDVPPVNRSIADLSAQLQALSVEEREEAQAALKDMVAGF